MWLRQNAPKILFLIPILLAVFSAAGCVSLPDPEVAQVHHTTTIASLHAERVEKSSKFEFKSRRDGLDSVTLWLKNIPASGSDAPAAFSIELFDSSDPVASPIFEAFYRLPSPDYNGPFRIAFSPISVSAEKSFLLMITAVEGQFDVMGAQSIGDPKPQTSTPTDADAPSFSTTYFYDVRMLIADARLWFSKYNLFIVAGLLLLVPGWLIIDFFSLNKSTPFWDQIGISAGISLAVIPLVMLWTRLFGFFWTPTVVYVMAVALFTVFLWRVAQHKPWRMKISIRMPDVALGFVLVCSFILRLIMVRDYTVPPWVDSVHHAVVTRFVQEQGGIPVTYGSQFDISFSAYHQGYHAVLAIYQWLSNLDLPNAMLVYGQILNSLGVIGAYLFAHTFTRNKWAGICGALAAGFLTPFPAYLTSWGRYTQLAGLIIFTSIIALSDGLLKQSAHNVRPDQTPRRILILVVSVCVAGLSLVHYRVTAFLALWWISLLLVRVFQKNWFIKNLQTITIVILTSICLNAYWAFSAIRHTFIPQINRTPGDTASLFRDFDPSVLTSAFGMWVLAVGIFGLLIMLVRETELGLHLCLWIASMFLVANLNALGIPGGAFVNNLSVEIALYLPISLFAGYAVSEMYKLLVAIVPKNFSYVLSVPITAGFIVLIFLGSRKLLPILNPNTVLAHQEDLTAVQWVRDNIPPTEKFLINPLEWGYGLCTGSDGGYWLTPIAANLTYPPPLIYYLGGPQLTQTFLEVCRQTQASAQDPEMLHALMASNQIKYIYLGQRAGLIQPAALQNSPLFHQVYRAGNVHIYAVDP